MAMNLRTGRRRATLAILAALGGCSAPRIESTSAPTRQRLTYPDRVVVSPFTVVARDGYPAQAANRDVTRPAEHEPLNRTAWWGEASATRTALQQTLVARLRVYGLPAEAGGAETAPGNALLIQGQIMHPSESNRATPRLIEFGGGPGSITAEVQLLYVAGAAAPQFLESFEATAPRPLGPSTSTDAAVPELTRIAEAMAKRIANFAVGQGWARLIP